MTEKWKEFDCLVYKYYDFEKLIFCAFRFFVHLVVCLTDDDVTHSARDLEFIGSEEAPETFILEEQLVAGVALSPEWPLCRKLLWAPRKDPNCLVGNIRLDDEVWLLLCSVFADEKLVDATLGAMTSKLLRNSATEMRSLKSSAANEAVGLLKDMVRLAFTWLYNKISFSCLTILAKSGRLAGSSLQHCFMSCTKLSGYDSLTGGLLPLTAISWAACKGVSLAKGTSPKIEF